MSIVIHLGSDVNEYKRISEGIIKGYIRGGKIRCMNCMKPMRRHSSYERGIKESGEQITIIVVCCRKCGIWQALLPDFLLQDKHYSGNEIESVIIDSATEPNVLLIDTKASGNTVRRWIRQIGERVRQAVGILKYLFGRDGQAVSEVAIDPGPAYSELEQVLAMAPSDVKCCGNKLGLANIWLWTNKVAAHI